MDTIWNPAILHNRLFRCYIYESCANHSSEIWNSGRKQLATNRFRNDGTGLKILVSASLKNPAKAFPWLYQSTGSNHPASYYSFITVALFQEFTASGGARTHNLWLRRPTLYPVELRMRQVWTIGSVRNAVKRKWPPLRDDGRIISPKTCKEHETDYSLLRATTFQTLSATACPTKPKFQCRPLKWSGKVCTLHHRDIGEVRKNEDDWVKPRQERRLCASPRDWSGSPV